MDISLFLFTIMFLIVFLYVLPSDRMTKCYKVGAGLALIPALWHVFDKFFPESQYSWAVGVDAMCAIIGVVALILLARGSKFLQNIFNLETDTKER